MNGPVRHEPPKHLLKFVEALRHGRIPQAAKSPCVDGICALEMGFPSGGQASHAMTFANASGVGTWLHPIQ